jgi:cell division protein FtsB
LPLKQAAGDCLDVAQCKKCALNVIAYMKKVSIEEERQRQIDLKKKRGMYFLFSLLPRMLINWLQIHKLISTLLIHVEEQLKLEEQEKAKAKEVKALKDQEREFRRRINEQKKKEIFADTSERKETNGKLDHSSEDRKQFAKSKSSIVDKKEVIK